MRSRAATRSRRLLTAATVVALGAAGLTALPACSPQCPSAVNLTVIIPVIYRFDQQSYSATAKAGCALVVRFENHDGQSHSLVFLGDNGAPFGRRLLAPGVGRTYSVSAKAGNYTLYCDIPGHRENGQQAALTVS